MNAARALVFLLIGYAALLTEGALAFLLPSGRTLFAVPELALAVVIYLGLCGRGGGPGLVAVALSLGYLRDLFLGAPRGVEALAFAIVALCARAMHGRVFLERFGQLASVAAAMSLLHAFLVVTLGAGDAPLVASLRPLPGLFIAAILVGPIALRVLRRVDLRLVPESRAISLEGDRGGAWR